jgi:Bacterial protein of unknown function (DUF839)
MVRIRIALVCSAALLSTTALAGDLSFEPVAAAMVKADGQSTESVLAAGMTQQPVAVGAMKLENPSATKIAYGYANDGPMVPAAGDVQAKGHMIEASKTEPDKNTYLVLKDQVGADAAYAYGTHFIFQGHEAGAVTNEVPQGAITRVNLDADEAHRVTLLAEKDKDGKALPFIDGSTWSPLAQRLLFTGEEGDEGGVWQATAQFPSKVENLTGVMGIGSYEGVQNDKDGNVWLVEDAGGKTGDTNTHAKQPNSFIYRFTPADKTDYLKGGRLEALQLMTADGQPIVFHDGKRDDDALSSAMKALHTYGTALKVTWVMVHDTAKDGMTPFKANDLAKIAMASPFKRPENGQFRPGSNFTEFFFTETGDTNLETEAKSEFGGFGGIFKLKLPAGPSTAEGVLQVVYVGDAAHTGFDNLAFASANDLLIVEDAGDKVHGQRKAFDSGYALDLTQDYGAGAQPKRFLALGRDPSATIDSALSAVKDTGFQNSGDNEITGIHVSDGDATMAGLLGAKVPKLGDGNWRMFYSQQHGDNRLFEVKLNATM